MISDEGKGRATSSDGSPQANSGIEDQVKSQTTKECHNNRRIAKSAVHYHKDTMVRGCGLSQVLLLISMTSDAALHLLLYQTLKSRQIFSLQTMLMINAPDNPQMKSLINGCAPLINIHHLESTWFSMVRPTCGAKNMETAFDGPNFV